jgi:DNA polymerase III delta prime subunit
MINKVLKEKYKFVTDFFETAVSFNKIANAYLLSGSDIIAQYAVAMEVARILNCNCKSNDCECTSCSWIRNNKHPAVITISPIDYTYANKDGKPATLITVNQARYLKQELSATSAYHRIIIFTDAEEIDEKYNRYNFSINNHNLFKPPVSPENQDKIRYWFPKPLNRRIFQEEPANALLKSIEEPGQNITFFFLANDKEDMLETIVSRCQCIPVNTSNKTDKAENMLDDIYSLLPFSGYNDALIAAEKFNELSKINGIPIENLLDMLQNHILSLMEHNSCNQQEYMKINKLIKQIEHAKQHLQSYVNPNTALENLFFSIV